jgi:hypothetical protein
MVATQVVTFNASTLAPQPMDAKMINTPVHETNTVPGVEANTETVSVINTVPAPGHDLAGRPFTQGNFTCSTCGIDLGEGCARQVCGRHGFCDFYFLYE